MKYVIEIEDEPFVRKSALHGEEAVYRAKGFKSLVFDKNGLDKLIPLKENEDNEFHVGDGVKKGNDIGYVLVPNYRDNKNIFVGLILDKYASPQILYKDGWHKIGVNDEFIRECVLDSADALDYEIAGNKL